MKIISLFISIFFASVSYAQWLENDIPVTGLSGQFHNVKYFKINIPSGLTDLAFKTWNGPGDCDLYVAFNREPTTADYDKASDRDGNYEEVLITNPQQGDWFIMLYAYAAYSGLSLIVSDNSTSCTYLLSPAIKFFKNFGGYGYFEVNTSPGCSWLAITEAPWIDIPYEKTWVGNGEVNFYIAENPATSARIDTIYIENTVFTVIQEAVDNTEYILLENNIPQNNLSGDKASEIYYGINIPQNAISMLIELWGGEGDCDIYIKYNDFPTTEYYDYEERLSGNLAQLTIEKPTPGFWYFMLFGYEEYSDTTFTVSYFIDNNYSFFDINSDGLMNLCDLILTMKILEGEDLNNQNSENLDINGDGKVGLEEVIFVLKVLSS